MKRFAIPSSVVLLFTIFFATPALAATPGNDIYANRTVIGSLPFTDAVDTTDATTDAVDAEANVECGAPATDASVWYEYSPAADAAVIVDVSASDYSAGVIVVSGSPGGFVLEGCGPFGAAFFGAAGTTYSILAFDDQEDGAGTGGMLSISVEEAPPPPSVDVTVDPVGTFNPRTGTATISGTASCSTDAIFGEIDVELRQSVGRFVVTGFGFAELTCDGTAQPWSMEVVGSNGLFKGGQAVVVANAFACGEFDCGTDFEEATIALRR